MNVDTKYLTFLDSLRESGLTNMYGASQSALVSWTVGSCPHSAASSGVGSRP
jgi:hypothetical protein